MNPENDLEVSCNIEEQFGFKPNKEVYSTKRGVGFLVTEAIRNEKNTSLTNEGALVSVTRDDSVVKERHTGRSTKDKYLVAHPEVEGNINWDDKENNRPMSPDLAEKLRKLMRDYASNKELYCAEMWAGGDPVYGRPVNVLTTLPSYALFTRHMLRGIPSLETLTSDDQKSAEERMKKPINIVFLPDLALDKKEYSELNSDGACIIDFVNRTIYAAGLKYRGEMKKGVFTMLNYLYPDEGVFPMHCSANKGIDDIVAIFFGLSGTGKTSLSVDGKRELIGDDEHTWSPRGIANMEGGCYAKLIRLSITKEAEIYNAVHRAGAILENVVMTKDGRINFDDDSIIENTRGSYPLRFLDKIAIEGTGGHPKVIFFLTADGFGVLPPLSRLDVNAAKYHFSLGYTSKLAGTEVGIKEPKTTSSAGFGKPFLPRHPFVYADLLAKYLREHPDTKIYLLNTGWMSGPYGVGERIDINYSRAMVNAAISGQLDGAPTQHHGIFNLQMVTSCPNVPNDIMIPWKTWQSGDKYNDQAKKLAGWMTESFKKQYAAAPKEILEAGPRL